MVNSSRVLAIVVASAIALSGSHAQQGRRLGARPTSKENLVNLDLLEADADFERLLGSTHYTSYTYKSPKTRGTKGKGKGSKSFKSDGKGSKSTKPYGKGSKGDDDGKGKGSKETKPYSNGKGAKYSDYEEKGAKSTKPYGKGSKGSKKDHTRDKPDKLEKVSQTSGRHRLLLFWLRCISIFNHSGLTRTNPCIHVYYSSVLFLRIP